MAKINRRTAMAGTLAIGASVASATGSENYQDEITPDQKFVMEAGLTREEAECWKKVAEVAGAFLKLPELHATDNQEVAGAIHIIQSKLLSRPTYRKYLKLAKAHYEKSGADAKQK